MSRPYLAAVVLFLGGLLVRDSYEALKKTGRVDTGDVRMFSLVFASMCVMWVSWFAMGILDPRRVETGPLGWIGLAAVTVGAVLAVGGVVQLRGVENIDHLVTSGLFSRIRHPMYVGFMLWILGWATFRGAPWSLVIGLPGIASIAWWRHLEETALESVYGKTYSDYRATTWF